LKTVKKSAAKSSHPTIGIIGGSGLYAMKGLTDIKEIKAKTPFGKPSEAIVTGLLEGKRVAFLAPTDAAIAFSPPRSISAPTSTLSSLSESIASSPSALSAHSKKSGPRANFWSPINSSIAPKCVSTFFGGPGRSRYV
jgi:5'-methylthioadenosine phosphorylase